jgi:hypothetical protein
MNILTKDYFNKNNQIDDVEKNNPLHLAILFLDIYSIYDMDDESKDILKIFKKDNIDKKAFDKFKLKVDKNFLYTQGMKFLNYVYRNTQLNNDDLAILKRDEILRQINAINEEINLKRLNQNKKVYKFTKFDID